MSSIPTPSNDRGITYDEPCRPWCFYWPGPHDPDGGERDERYCHRVVGRTVIGLSCDDDRYEITAMLIYERLPAGTPIEQQANANRHHRDVLQIGFVGDKGGLPVLTADIKPGDARSLAAALIHGADVAEGIIR